MRLSAGLTIVAAVLLLLLPAPAAVAHSTSVEQNGLLYFFATERDTYTMHELVPLELSVTNVSEEPMGVFHPCAGLGGIDFAIWDPDGPYHQSEVVWHCCGCFTEAWLDTLGVGESYHREVTWDMYHIYDEELIWRAGTYTLEGNISLASFPDFLDLSCTLYLEVEIPSGTADLPEDDSVAWGRIKALYR